MTGSLVYLDSSAIIKLIFEEPESDALSEFLATWPTRASSVLAEVEVLRASGLVGDTLVVRQARQILDGMDLILTDERLLATAASCQPVALRTLDAIHLATALSLGSELAGMVVYDRKLRAAARDAGIRVWSPS